MRRCGRTLSLGRVTGELSHLTRHSSAEKTEKTNATRHANSIQDPVLYIARSAQHARDRLQLPYVHADHDADPTGLFRSAFGHRSCADYDFCPCASGVCWTWRLDEVTFSDRFVNRTQTTIYRVPMKLVPYFREVLVSGVWTEMKV